MQVERLVMTGWFKHPRNLDGSFDPNPLKDFKLSLIYLHLVKMANWEDSETLLAGQVKTSVPEIQKATFIFSLEETRALVDRLCKLGLISLSRVSHWRNAGYVTTITDYATKFLVISTHDPINPYKTHTKPIQTPLESLENVDDSPYTTHTKPITYSREKRSKRKKAEEECFSPDEDTSYLDIATEWNKKLPNHQQINLTVLRNNPKRKNDIRKYIEKHTLEILMLAIDKISKSEFLCGKSERKFKPKFTWFMETENLQKILEGNYDTVFGKEAKEEYKGPFDVRNIVLCNQPTKLN